MYGTQMYQGFAGLLINSTPLRTIVLFWWLFTILFLAGYTSRMVSMFVVKSPAKQINTLQDIINEKQVTVHLPPNTSVHSLFERDPDSIYGMILATKHIEMVHVMPGWKKIMISDNNVFLADDDFIHGMTKDNASVYVSKRGFHDRYVAFAVRNSFPYKDEFNQKIQQLLESGIIASWKRRYKKMYFRQFRNNITRSAQQSSITVSDLAPMFIWLFSGMCGVTFCLT